MKNEILNVLRTSNRTKAVATYLELIEWMIENNIKEEDLAKACEIFLLINHQDKTSINVLSTQVQQKSYITRNLNNI